MSLDPPAEPLDDCDGTEMVRVRKGNRWRWLTIGTLTDFILRRQASRDAAQDAALAAEAMSRSQSDASQGGRIAALEAKPEEVVPFSGSIPTGVLAIGSKAYIISGLAGVKAGERVAVTATGTWPAGLSIALVRVPADGQVEITLNAGIAITASKTVTVSIAVLR